MSTLTTNDVTMWDDVQHTRKRPSVNLGTDPFTTGAHANWWTTPWRRPPTTAHR